MFHFMEERLHISLSILPHQNIMFDATITVPAFLSWNSYYLKKVNNEIHINWSSWASELKAEESKGYIIRFN